MNNLDLFSAFVSGATTLWVTYKLGFWFKRWYDALIREPLERSLEAAIERAEHHEEYRDKYYAEAREHHKLKVDFDNFKEAHSRVTATECNAAAPVGGLFQIPEADLLRGQVNALESQLKLVVESRKQSAEQAESLAKQLAEERSACERMKNGLDYFHKRWENVSGKLRKFWLSRNYWKDQAERFQVACTRAELECGALRRELELKSAKRKRKQ